jgi:hypothetical protein
MTRDISIFPVAEHVMPEYRHHYNAIRILHRIGFITTLAESWFDVLPQNGSIMADSWTQSAAARDMPDAISGKRAWQARLQAAYFLLMFAECLFLGGPAPEIVSLDGHLLSNFYIVHGMPTRNLLKIKSNTFDKVIAWRRTAVFRVHNGMQRCIPIQCKLRQRP